MPEPLPGLVTVRLRVEFFLKAVERILEGERIPGVYERIAQECGCSREYVRQIAMKNGYERLNNKLDGKKPEYTLTCQQCGISFTSARKNQKNCSPACRRGKQLKALNTDVICDFCGTHFPRRNKLIIEGKKNFCTRRCMGLLLGKNNLGRRFTKITASVDGIEEKIGKEFFTVEDFGRAWGFKTHQGAAESLRRLRFQGKVKQVTSKVWTVIKEEHDEIL